MRSPAPVFRTSFGIASDLLLGMGANGLVEAKPRLSIDVHVNTKLTLPRERA